MENKRDRITDQHNAVNGGVEENLRQMRESVGNVDEAHFTGDSADKNPVGASPAEKAPNTNYEE